MEWKIPFISRKDFFKHVKETVESYFCQLKPFDLKRLAKNKIDPIKLTFDHLVYDIPLERAINEEAHRQRDKANNNAIGYFHQRIFAYIKNCKLIKNGKVWDVVYFNQEGIFVPGTERFGKITKAYVEIKNKYNTMNSKSRVETYNQMKQRVDNEAGCVCFLVEVVSNCKSDSRWEISNKGEKLSDDRIRKLRIDDFYSLVTGRDDAFRLICDALPQTIIDVLDEYKIKVAKNIAAHQSNTATAEIARLADRYSEISKELRVATTLIMLGFKTYKGLNKMKKIPYCSDAKRLF